MAPSLSGLAVTLVAAVACTGSEAFVPAQHPLLLSRGHCAVSKFSSRCLPTLRAGRRAVSISSTATAPRMDAQSKVSTAEEFWTRPRTTNANWGVFFEIVAKDRPIWITGIRAGGHSFADHDEYTRMKAENFKLPRVEVGEIQPLYTPLPFSTVHIPANSVRAFCIHTDKKNGLALRRKLNFDSNNIQDPYFREWTDGVTDECDHMKLIAGLVPGEKLFTDVSSTNNARAFVGVIEYQLTDPSK